MFVMHFCVHEPHSGAKYEAHEVLHTQFRLRVTRTHGVTRDESILFPATPWSGFGARPQLALALEGAQRNLELGVVRWASAGGFALGRSLDSLYTRVEPDSTILSLDWSLGSLGSRAPEGLPEGEVSEMSRARLLRCANVLATWPTAVDATELVGEVFEVLRAEGVPIDSIGARDLVEQVTPQERQVITVLSDMLSRLDETPMSVDIEQRLGRSRRTVVDLIGHVSHRFGLNGRDWRTLRNRCRLTAAAVLSTHDSACTEHVARAVGYGSARALCHAFARAQLPSPGAMRSAVKNSA